MLTDEQKLFMHLRAGVSQRCYDAWEAAVRPRQKADGEIHIYGLILSEGEAAWGRMFGDESAVTATQFRKDLEAIKGDVVIRINSDGGDAFEASAIIQAIQERGSGVKCIVDGMAASAASLVACVCPDVTVAKMGNFMIHRAATWVTGDADALRQAADFLGGIDDQAAKIYHSRAKDESEKSILKMMADETYLTAEESVKIGFADRVFEPEESGPDFVQQRNSTLAAILAAQGI